MTAIPPLGQIILKKSYSCSIHKNIVILSIFHLQVGKLGTVKYTNEQVVQAVASSTSIRQVLLKLSLKEAGGNYKTIKTIISNLNLDTSHFHGMLWSKGKKIGPKRPIEDYLSNKQTITSWKLKNRILLENLKKHQCEKCLLTEWLGDLVPLELHHIDGKSNNNNLDNLQLLCPNCHTLTENYRGKKLKKT